MKQIKLVRVRIMPTPNVRPLTFERVSDTKHKTVQVSGDVLERWNKAEVDYAAYQLELKELY